MRHRLHVRDTGANIFGRDILSHEFVYSAPERFEHGGSRHAGVYLVEDCLPAARRQLRECVFVAHAPREAQGVHQGGVLADVGRHTAPPRRRTESRRVNGDYAGEPGLSIFN
jgi:hypothetical protein